MALETGDEEIAVSVITVLELAHGSLVPIRLGVANAGSVFFTTAGRLTLYSRLRHRSSRGPIDGQSQARGFRIPLADLLIGASALELGYRMGTANLRHFQLIPGLSVVHL